MTDLVTVSDVLDIDPNIGEAKAQAMLNLVMAKAFAAAPCLRSVDDQNTINAVKAIIVPAVVRWAATPAGIDVSTAAGPFNYTAKTPSGLLWKSELAELRDLCPKSSAASGMSRARFPNARPFPGYET